ncbi:MAG: histidinol dehydrogenase [Candidatus Korobacteraceae bacterium]
MRVLAGKAAERAVNKLEGRASRLEEVEPAVNQIIHGVRKDGDKALVRYATLWDNLHKGQALRVPQQEIDEAWKATPLRTRKALKHAAANIRRFANWQLPRPWQRKISGGELGQVVRPLRSAGCYVPGGRYPLPSTLLMTAIPAQVAGVERIVVVTPNPQPATLAAAHLLGISEVYRCGGAQAIAALAYGTDSIAQVDKIVGPGNAYVTAAKKLVSFDCAIDMLAGPTEAAIYSESGNAEFLASDLVAQAEHDPDAVVVFISTSAALAKAVAASVRRAAKGNPIATKAIKSSAYALVATSREQATEWVNRIAAEHLTVDDDATVPAVLHAGSIFVGSYSPQSAGDYAAGPNHVLPTAGAARFRGGLSAADFVKVITVQKFLRDGLREIAPVVTTLAETEGLRAHAQSVRVRCGDA